LFLVLDIATLAISQINHTDATPVSDQYRCCQGIAINIDWETAYP
jgi:hypothetical protein